ncbi:hypothetical protein M0812_16854 [Anaeramoeba flamelloides]|uniref:Uncharacterized protein n=1 Tax=Anaeramoeba flamelloides TaxID=1746091 RepID=A0AAV7ZBF6_9EUKA|nr:hypothetical protein M0812_16854 [Anaeramoeba flamelloides]
MTNNNFRDSAHLKLDFENNPINNQQQQQQQQQQGYINEDYYVTMPNPNNMVSLWNSTPLDPLLPAESKIPVLSDNNDLEELMISDKKSRKQRRVGYIFVLVCIFIIVLVVVLVLKKSNNYFSFGNANSDSGNDCSTQATDFSANKMVKNTWISPDDNTNFKTQIYWTGSWSIKYRINEGEAKDLTLESGKCYRTYAEQNESNCYTEFIGKGTSNYDDLKCEIV